MYKLTKAKRPKPVTKNKIYLTDIKEIYGAMYHGMQIFCNDGTSWYSLTFKIGKLHIFGKFEKSED